MLTIEQIIPWIRHDDPLVARLALDHLSWVRQPRRLTGDFLLEAIREGHASLEHWLPTFEPTAAVMAHALRTIAEEKADGHADWPYVVISAAADDLFTADVIRELKELKFNENRKSLRLEMMQWSNERIEAAFLEEAKTADRDGTAMSEQHELLALSNRIIYRPECHGWAIEQFHRHLGTNGGAEIWLFGILRRARFRPAFEAALTRFPQTNYDDNESLMGEIEDAIVEFCEPGDLSRLESLWDSSDEEHRACLICGVARLRFAEAEPLLLRFAREAKDASDITIAAEGLCEMLCSNDDSREFVRELVEGERFDIAMCDLEELAIPMGIIQQKPFAEEPAWRERIRDPKTRRDARLRKIAARLPHIAEMSRLLKQLEAEDSNQNRIAGAAPEFGYYDDDEAYEPRESINPIVAAEKIGRNDPCPCGSGKKYKKCCLK